MVADVTLTAVTYHNIRRRWPSGIVMLHLYSSATWDFQSLTSAERRVRGAVWKSRRPSWAPRPNEPYGLCGRKAILNHASALVTVCPEYIDRHPRTWSSTSSSWGERWARALALESQRGHQMDGWPLHAYGFAPVQSFLSADPAKVCRIRL